MAEGRDITAEVKRIIKEQLDVEESQIRPEMTFIDDLGADSLGLVELVLAFEESFTIDIPDEDTEKIRTVQDAIDYIEKHIKKLSRPGPRGRPRQAGGQRGPARGERAAYGTSRCHGHWGRDSLWSGCPVDVGGAAGREERRGAHHAV